MKKTTHLLYAILAASIYTSSAHASCTDGTGCLQVPGDFSNPVNNFSMYLLGGWFRVQTPTGSYVGGSSLVNTAGKQIDFTASPFDHVGPGQGTSSLSASFDRVELGSGMVAGFLGTFYLNGPATGTLVDNTDSTQGHWTMNAHLFADWNLTYGIDLGVVPISTNASYSYRSSPTTTSIATGTIMNYYTGLAYMVGQGTTLSGPFQNMRVTLGLNGQDPATAPIPVPAAAWLLGSGLLGLAGFARKRKIT